MNRFFYDRSSADREALRAIEDAWDGLNVRVREHSEAILQVMQNVNERMSIGHIPPAQFNRETEFELSEQIPECIWAINGMRRAIAYLDARSVRWWELGDREPIRRPDNDLLDGIVAGTALVEDGLVYRRFMGKVLGTEVGFNAHSNNLDVAVTIQHDHETPTSARVHPFYAMYGIELDCAAKNSI